MTGWFAFLKGHGTENDFVLLPDPDGSVHRELSADLAADLVAGLCDRHAGIGGDGVLRAVHTEASADPAAVSARGRAEWFMDYRNSDGSLGEMCGNGIRVFVRYLLEHQGVTGPTVPVATRAGVKQVVVNDDGSLTVDMGRPKVLSETKVTVAGRTWPAMHIGMGNPHAVVLVEDLAVVGSLAEPPTYDDAVYPDGVNVEIVQRLGRRHIVMRVHERGSGETRSCGTGACAAMVASAVAEGPAEAHSSGYRVDVPGGTLHVAWHRDRVLLTGGAVIVAEGTTSYSVLPDA
jgi:diaminopimelate epimerase